MTEVFQTAFELERVSALCRSLHPSRVLEIGAWKGGTLIEWIRAEPDLIVVVDDEMRDEQTWRRWADDASVDLELVRGVSQWPDTVAAVARLAPFDWVFVDADHAYAAVRADWDNYRPMVAPGGAVAFHDIHPRPGYGVHDLWCEIKAEPGIRWMEIQQTPGGGNGEYNGIGVVWPT